MVLTMSAMFLTKDEVAELTGRKVKAKQIVQLRSMRIVFWINADGVPIVPRTAIEGSRPASVAAEPKWEMPP